MSFAMICSSGSALSALLPCDLEHQSPEQVHRRYPVQPMARVVVRPPVDQSSDYGIGRVQLGTGRLQPTQDVPSRRAHYGALLAAALIPRPARPTC